MKKMNSYEQDLARLLKKKGMREYYEEYGRQLEIAYKIAEARAEAKLSQAQLAKKIGTKQSNVARMEAGEQNFTVSTLMKIAHSLGRELKVSFL